MLPWMSGAHFCSVRNPDSNSCPSDVPSGVTAKPGMYYGRAEFKWCVLYCNGTDGSHAQCGEALCQSDVCTYLDTTIDWHGIALQRSFEPKIRDADVFDFRFFESDLFQRWEAKFRRGGSKIAGSYAFFPNDLEPSMYGSADVGYTYFALGLLEDLSRGPKVEWATNIKGFQNATGEHWFSSRPGPASYGNLPLGVEHWHAAAEASEVLMLLDEKPTLPFLSLQELEAGNGTSGSDSRWQDFMEKFLSNSTNIWRDSAAIQAPLGIAKMIGSANPSFVAWYFQWLNAHVDPQDGFWYDSARSASKLQAMASAFHMLHNYDCFQRPWPNPSKQVDAALDLQLDSGLWGPEPSTCLDLDGVYIAIRASEQSARHRWDDVREACRRFLRWTVAHLNNETYVLTAYAEHTHLLHGPIFAVAECQQAFPELGIRTLRPWRRSRDACIYAKQATETHVFV